MVRPEDAKKPTDAAAVCDRASPLLLDAHHAAAVCGTSARTWRAWDVAGKIPAPVRIGRRTFWRLEELQSWVAAGCPDRLTREALRE
jgi:predicted DNA-binding transcriptional regulator AlpA